TVKEKFHQLIDSIDDPKLLAELYEALSEYQNNKLDILDELNSDQKKRLYESVEQSKRGEVKDWAVVKNEVEQGFARKVK
ncbi:MAG: hypothetical protein PHP42_13650, partial [Bacteroidota bacterium]|nr:hypothetical protein [Bacteroidota bacterium]